MPEIKHQFTSGKMNKDVDERLVPNGEYRDAMNVQVATSEGSDVGTVQNILGNIAGCEYPNKFGVLSSPIPEGSTTVGSISDEKNDTLYWLTAGQHYSLNDFGTIIYKSQSLELSQDHILYDISNGIVSKDLIMRKTPSACEPVFVDITSVLLGFPTETPTPGSCGVCFDHLDFPHIESGSVFVPSEGVLGITPGMFVTGITDTGIGFSNSVIVENVIIDDVGEITKVSFNNELDVTIPPSTVFTLFDVEVEGTAKTNYGNDTYSPTDRLLINNWGSEEVPAVGDEVEGLFLPPYGLSSVKAVVSNVEGLSTNQLQVTINYDPAVTPPILDIPNWKVSGGTTVYPLYIAVTFTRSTTNAGTKFDYLFFHKDRVLNFDKDKLITGINIIDDILLWTDNNTEPKKINIPRSIDGTDKTGAMHTRLINKSLVDFSDARWWPIKEEHITVIKKSPKFPLTFNLQTDRVPKKNYTGVIKTTPDPAFSISILESSFVDLDDPTLSSANFDFGAYGIGDTFHVRIETSGYGGYGFKLNAFPSPDLWTTGTDVVLREFDDSGNPPPFPIGDTYRIKGHVTDWDFSENEQIYDVATSTITQEAYVAVTITSIIGSPPIPEIGAGNFLNYAIDAYSESDKLFEFKFPRFSYRYKYKDGEYSCFAPFTEVAFAPGSFDYHPKKGYNLGMTNRVVSIEVENFITPDMPKDVVEIDLLYKDDVSPNIYIIDTISPKDQPLSGQVNNIWNSNLYTISSDTIYAVVPSNQLLRPWDNVPRKALTQEITGNRVVYGNYMQNYNLTLADGITGFYPDFKWSIESSGAALDKYGRNNIKSIKSLRDYQLGVVFIDKYGRETPVISNLSGVFKISKNKSAEENRLKVGLSAGPGGVPADFKYYKFFIKETSGEYYNLAMDRFYDAEDGNYWLSFPSSDRNKVDIDTFLILKKSVGSSKLILEPGKYKILAIESEAPDHIKTKKYNIGEAIGIFGNVLDNSPVNGTSDFDVFSENFDTSSAAQMDEITDPLYIEFEDIGTGTISNRYRITEITRGETVDKFFIKTEKPLGDDVIFMLDNPVVPTKIKGSIKARVWKYSVEKKAKFDGRFFVKIYGDEVFRTYVELPAQGMADTSKKRVVSSKKIYYMAENHVERHGEPGKNNIRLFGPDSAVFGGSDPSDDSTYGTIINQLKNPYGVSKIQEYVMSNLYGQGGTGQFIYEPHWGTKYQPYQYPLDGNNQPDTQNWDGSGWQGRQGVKNSNLDYNSKQVHQTLYGHYPNNAAVNTTISADGWYNIPSNWDNWHRDQWPGDFASAYPGGVTSELAADYNSGATAGYGTLDGNGWDMQMQDETSSTSPLNVRTNQGHWTEQVTIHAAIPQAGKWVPDGAGGEVWDPRMPITETLMSSTLGGGDQRSTDWTSMDNQNGKADMYKFIPPSVRDWYYYSAYFATYSERTIYPRLVGWRKNRYENPLGPGGTLNNDWDPASSWMRINMDQLPLTGSPTTCVCSIAGPVTEQYDPEAYLGDVMTGAHMYYDVIDERGVYIDDELDTYEDVWFIDNGPRVGVNSHNQESWGHNYIDSPHNFHNYPTVDGDGVFEPEHGIGILNDIPNNSGKMELCFGGIDPEKRVEISYPSEEFGTPGNIPNLVPGGVYGPAGVIAQTDNASKPFNQFWIDKAGTLEDNFWDLAAEDREKYRDELDMIKRLTSGSQFRWKEDPTRTTYTVQAQVEEANRLRYDSNPLNHQGFNKNASFVPLYTRTLTDATNTFLKGAYTTTSYLAKIGSVYSESTSEGYARNAGGDISPYSSGSLTHNIAEMFPLNIGNRIENFFKNYQLSFIPAMTSWDPIQNGDLGPILGGITIDKYVTDGTTIPVTSANITASSANSSGAYVTISITQYESTYDTTYNTREQILPGFILTTVGDIRLTVPVLVKNVTRVGKDYVIDFTGYQSTNAKVVILDGDALVFQQPTMNGISVNSAKNITETNPTTSGIGAVGYTLEFVEPMELEQDMPTNPAIWETEPKDSFDPDIYYEISGSNAIILDNSTSQTVLPHGAAVSVFDGNTGSPITTAYTSTGILTIENTFPNNDIITLSEPLYTGSQAGYVNTNDMFRITKRDGTTFDIEIYQPINIQEDAGGNFFTAEFKLKPFLYNAWHYSSWFNCYAWGNGVESNRIRDNFNLPFITNGVKASTTLEGQYKEEHRKYGLIYSGLYNSNSGVNNLNQFIQAEKITKDVNPIYGSIQKLHSRDTDLVTLCEDKCLRILANKDAVFNADGNPQLTANHNVLGQTIPFSGEFGISTNPESFASESYRVYFTDRVRGAVMRLSKDGLTPISMYGMRDWFKDNLKLSNKIVGSYDDKKDEYNVTLKDIDETVTFREDVKGWVSFKSFFPENGISTANDYYTFLNGNLYKHHVETSQASAIDRNTFYGDFTPSSVNVILNNAPGVVKSFSTLNYEGSQAKVKEFTADATTGLTDGEYYNLKAKLGWYVEAVETNKEKGSLKEFIEKEGKWFGYLKGHSIEHSGDKVKINDDGSSSFDQASFAIQGLGRTNDCDYGCNDPIAINYNSKATCDDGSCIYTEPEVFCGVESSVYYGCMDPNACNYDPTANCDDGSCRILQTRLASNSWTEEVPCKFDAVLCLDASGSVSGNGNVDNMKSFATGIVTGFTDTADPTSLGNTQMGMVRFGGGLQNGEGSFTGFNSMGITNELQDLTSTKLELTDWINNTGTRSAGNTGTIAGTGYHIGTGPTSVFSSGANGACTDPAKFCGDEPCGTDIIGGIWHALAILYGPTARPGVAKKLFIAYDGADGHCGCNAGKPCAPNCDNCDQVFNSSTDLPFGWTSGDMDVVTPAISIDEGSAFDWDLGGNNINWFINNILNNSNYADLEVFSIILDPSGSHDAATVLIPYGKQFDSSPGKTNTYQATFDNPQDAQDIADEIVDTSCTPPSECECVDSTWTMLGGNCDAQSTPFCEKCF